MEKEKKRGQTHSRDARNWLIHDLYVRQQLKECKSVIETQLKQHKGQCEYALYVKGLIKREEGEIEESLQLFQQATQLNPTNVSNLKQVGRSLYLLGKHRAAINVYDSALELLKQASRDDWEIWHNKGLCFMYLQDPDMALKCFLMANRIQRHDITFIMIGKLQTMAGDYKKAISVYQEALEFSPENPDLLTTLGLLYLRDKENYRAFDHLGNALTYDKKNPKTILAAGSIIQKHADYEAALNKYRVAAVATPNSPQLWNNIGMCFFGKKKYVAAIACLKRALFLAPFEWLISYNVGIVHLATKQYASAFHYLSAAINLKPDFPLAYVYLGVALSHLDDIENACNAYEKAMQMKEYLDSPHLLYLNYAITLLSAGEIQGAKRHFNNFEKVFGQLSDEEKSKDPEVTSAQAMLSKALS